MAVEGERGRKIRLGFSDSPLRHKLIPLACPASSNQPHDAVHYILSLFPGLLTPWRGEGSSACRGHAGVGCTHTEGRGRRVPSVGHQTGLAEEGTFWAQMGMGETGVVFAGR